MTTRGRGRYGQRLLLFAALLLGIVTMHTLGHPSGHRDGHPSGAGRAAGAGHMAYASHGMDAAPGSEHAAQAVARHDTPTTKTPPMSGMDPFSVCLAVLLGGFTLLLLLATALGRAGTAAVRPAGLSRLLRALWPVPPPPRTLLSRLSVLRI